MKNLHHLPVMLRIYTAKENLRKTVSVKTFINDLAKDTTHFTIKESSEYKISLTEKKKPRYSKKDVNLAYTYKNHVLTIVYNAIPVYTDDPRGTVVKKRTIVAKNNIIPKALMNNITTEITNWFLCQKAKGYHINTALSSIGDTEMDYRLITWKYSLEENLPCQIAEEIYFKRINEKDYGDVCNFFVTFKDKPSNLSAMINVDVVNIEDGTEDRTTGVKLSKKISTELYEWVKVHVEAFAPFPKITKKDRWFTFLINKKNQEKIMAILKNNFFTECFPKLVEVWKVPVLSL